MSDFTDLLRRVEAGEAGAFDELAKVAYPELRKLARSRLYGSGPQTLLGTTTLVHECFLRLADRQPLSVEDRKRFFAYASKVMRSIIVDMVREARAQKRRPEEGLDTLGTTALEQPAPNDDVIRIDQALSDLARIEPELARVVEMRFFGGLTEVEIANALSSSERTVQRQWERARLLLADMLAPGDL